MFKYRNLKTNKVLKTKTPLKGKKKLGYRLLEWRKNAMMKSVEVNKKQNG